MCVGDAGSQGIKVTELMCGRDHFGKISIAKTLNRMNLTRVLERGSPGTVTELHASDRDCTTSTIS